jgi:hypothetical protein
MGRKTWPKTRAVAQSNATETKKDREREGEGQTKIVNKVRKELRTEIRESRACT